MKKKTRDKEIEELLKPLSPIKEFIPREKGTSGNSGKRRFLLIDLERIDQFTKS